MTTTFGEVSWDSDVFEGGKSAGGGKDLFLRLDEGDNEMRLITQPFQYYTHKFKKDPNNIKDFGVKINCSISHGTCPLCELGEDKAKPRWLLGVISRKTGLYKILDISYAVFGNIRKLARNTARWGDPTKYDINIIKDSNAPPTSFYTVQPLPKEPLSVDELKIKESVDLSELKRRVTPPTAEQVKQRMEKVRSATQADVKVALAKGASAPVVEDDSDFPEYNG